MTRRVIVAALAAAVLLAGGCSDDGYVAPTPAERTEVADPGVAGATVTTLQDALRDPDAAAALGADDRAASLLDALARNVANLRLSDVTLRYLTETGRTSGQDSWDGLVAITWRVSGFDEASSRAEVPFTFADGGRRIAAIGGDTGRLPLWLTGPVVVRRSAGALVLAAGTATDADRYARRATQAVRSARALLGGRERLVVEVPADPGQARPGAGRRPGHLQRDRRGHRARRRDPGRREPGARVRQPVRLRRPGPGRRPGRDDPRGGPRRHRRGAGPERAAVAGGGLRRLRRAA
ncbi:hypothetical protein G5V59_06825 [Nocardioides sp. W3-2-3]|uniref:hypothetical protein n=1 Tax=Nocardioides convexus TaxID=2712224 RepID=UPI0024185F95|nr:hypothetical protein [Nocardioides convexus]NHA00021.1 hypothetical protein [Nocardioides convexus]